MRRLSIALVAALSTSPGCASPPQEPAPQPRALKKLPGVLVGTYPQEMRRIFTTAHGLPDDRVLSVAVTPKGDPYAGTARGLARFDGGRWTALDALAGKRIERLAPHADGVLAISEGALWEADPRGARRVAALPEGVPRALAAGTRIAVLTDKGLSEFTDGAFTSVPGSAGFTDFALDGQGQFVAAGPSGVVRRGRDAWSPLGAGDVRAIAFDRRGRLWAVTGSSAGRFDEGWTLFTGHDGLPYDDFTCVAAGEDGVVWFGTRLGAIRYDGKVWEYRQGRSWLPGDEVRSIAVAADGRAWIATDKGLALIERRAMTLWDKARFYEEEIDKKHRRTPYGFVNGVFLGEPGDASRWSQHDSDNDGLWTGMYGAGECFAYAATRDPAAKRRAKAAFEALRFLSQVTQGGSHPAPRGFPARTILSTSLEDPNKTRYTLERDQKTQTERDRLWKVMHPRWPVSADGRWYWKCDTSSDELDGHYFFYGIYYDLVAETEEERAPVREVVTAITDHLIDHDFRLVDWDGRPTRWANYNPRSLNHDPLWWVERGLNSLSMLSYLKVAAHVSGEAKYARAARELIEKHAYAMNVMHPKVQAGPGSGNQSDDEMAFMCFYNLIRLEENPKLRSMYAMAFWRYAQQERPELNPFFNFAAAAVLSGERFVTAYEEKDLTPRGEWLEESIDTLKRFPLDRIRWSSSNSRRKDIVLLSPDVRGPGRGHRRDGKVVPVDERWMEHWNVDPWKLDVDGNGQELSDGASFLLPYYMGLFHGFIREER